MAVVRGPVLMLLNAWEFAGQEGQEPQVSAQGVGIIGTTAANKLRPERSVCRSRGYDRP